MDFQYFLSLITKLKTAVLSGMEAHLKMAPEDRKIALENIDFKNINPKLASVLMLIYPKNNQAHLVLILRNSYNGVHSSQVAFPGGKVEQTDASYQKTALRETFEEIGITENQIEIIKDFSEIYIPPSNFRVFPFLGFSKNELQFMPNKREVTKIIELPIASFLKDTILESQEISTSYSKKINVPGFNIDNHFVWGATAMILNELRQVILKEIDIKQNSI
jgi:8-oxo-dGTP pyrophosphatase MutT (NUDIX family)